MMGAFLQTLVNPRITSLVEKNDIEPKFLQKISYSVFWQVIKQGYVYI